MLEQGFHVRLRLHVRVACDDGQGFFQGRYRVHLAALHEDELRHRSFDGIGELAAFALQGFDRVNRDDLRQQQVADEYLAGFRQRVVLVKELVDHFRRQFLPQLLAEWLASRLVVHRCGEGFVPFELELREHGIIDQVAHAGGPACRVLCLDVRDVGPVAELQGNVALRVGVDDAIEYRLFHPFDGLRVDAELLRPLQEFGLVLLVRPDPGGLFERHLPAVAGQGNAIGRNRRGTAGRVRVVGDVLLNLHLLSVPAYLLHLGLVAGVASGLQLLRVVFADAEATALARRV